MTFTEFLYKVHAEARFKTSNNVMDRDMKVTIRKGASFEDVDIQGFEIDSNGNICIVVDAPDEEESA